jgi:hypothetical protein
MNNDTTVTVKINATDESKSAVKDATNNFANLWKQVAGGQIAEQVLSDAWEQVKSSFDIVKSAAEDWQAAQVQTEAVLRSTNDAIGITKEQAIKMAESFAKTTPITRDSALAAENMLLTFTNIGKDAFPGATKAVLDMATAMNGGATPGAQQLRDTAIQVGKALQDPATGMMNLRREGVNFTTAQTDMVKKWEATGQSAKAQQYIIGELSKEFGGSATAASKTFGGQVAILKNQLIDLGVNGLQTLADFANKQLLPELYNLINSFKMVYEKVINFLLPSLKALWNTVKNELFPALQNLWKQVIEPLLPVIGVALVAAIWLVTNALNLLLQILTPVMNFISGHKQLVIDLGLAFLALATYMKFESITAAFTGNMTTIMNSISGVSGSVTSLFTKISGGTVMGGIAVAGALVDIALVAQAVQTVMGAINAMNNAQNAQASAADQASAIKDIETRYKAGKLNKTQETNAINALLKGVDSAVAQSNHRAMGGSVSADEPYIVGEHGTELFIPNSSGTIVPSGQTKNIANNQKYSHSVTIQQLVLPGVTNAPDLMKALNQDILNVDSGLTPVQGTY